MFKEVKIEIPHDVTRILGHLLRNRMHCVVKIHNVAIWRAIYNTGYVCLAKMNFGKYTFNMIINYIKFREMSVCKFFPFPTTWLFQHDCIHFNQKYQMRWRQPCFRETNY